MNLFYALVQKMLPTARLDVAVGPLGGDPAIDTMICVILAVAVLAAVAITAVVLISRKKKKASGGAANAAEQPGGDENK